jgi:hypothetical protein
MSYPRVSPLGDKPSTIARGMNRLLRHMEAPTYSELIDAVDDAAAATAGVPLWGVYRTGSALKVRIA